MRDLKFRAWDKKNKEMINLYLWIVPCRPPEDMDLIRFGSCFKIDAEISDVMQYTGLKDSKGKEIYDGDILKTNKGVIGQVIWENTGVWFRYRNVWNRTYQQYIWKTLTWANTRSEIIGNVYANKDLLNV